jgi:hypothetical protein
MPGVLEHHLAFIVIVTTTFPIKPSPGGLGKPQVRSLQAV